ncbi:MmgE/PrpD family protein [Shinella curvata]|uniref:MmgE/PrpD family protein n=1 Tax=Shinella curvata TaxID=1817964 RepID=A0ABT8XHR9_9HYPH|nr:MmgE/PrpD family protein [Shinella curvata]MCJ8056114.1 MmgE/PrpD family protein [Shinella curvata]MDO6123285.1 MmgE/PrpD family protein [Shinella curvata]
MTGITETLARYAADLAYADLPPEVPVRAKHLAIDLVGSIVRAGKEADSTPSILGMLQRLGLDAPGTSTVFGLPRRYVAATATLLNGALGHSLDFDDTHADSSLHPSAPVVPAAFAAAELVGASGKDLLAAIVAGYEVCCRLGNALDPTAHYARGFHPTATAGTFGAAAAASKLLGLDAAGIASAFGIAASQAAGSLQFLVNGAWNKRYQVGAAAMNGLIAATLASEGFIGAADAIEGKHGLLVGYTDNPRPKRAVADLGTVYETMKIGMKPYPACRYTHAAVDGLLALKREHGWTPADILGVDIGLHKNGIVLTGAPLEDKRRPKTVVDGQFSMPFAAAVALYQGSFSWDDYALLGNSDIEAIAARVDVRREEQLEGLRHPFGARIAVRTAAGTVERSIPDPSGEPDSFPARPEIEAKFMTLTTPVLGNAASSLFSRLEGIEALRNIREIIA